MDLHAPLKTAVTTGDDDVTRVLKGPSPALVWPLTDTTYVPVASSEDRVANVPLVIRDFDSVWRLVLPGGP